MHATARLAAAAGALAMILGTLHGCRARGAADPAILVLGGESVRRSEFLRHLAAIEARGEEAVNPAVRRALLDAFLEQRVLVLEARSRGLVAAGATPDDEELAVQRLLLGAEQALPAPAQAEIEAYYRAHQSDFRTPELVTVRQILVHSENEARDIRRRLQKDPKNFEILARTLSRSPEAAQGGLLGTFARGELPVEIEQAAFALAPGPQTAIAVTPLGHHVLRVDARTPERVQTLEECAERIRSILARRRQDLASRQLVRELLARAKVNYEAAENPGPSS
jgi:parvulin-like peptidyl-prolyl isomerase